MEHGMHEEPEGRAIATRIATTASQPEREALLLWMVELLQIRDSSLSSVQKAKQAVVLTSRSKVIWPMVKLLAQEGKRVGWDERGTKSRFGIAGAGVGLALFGTQGAGIAALGGAIGVPLWVVLSAGAYFAPVLIDELRKLVPQSRQPVFRDGKYEVIDVEAKQKE
jgi:hypothetical protein